MADTGSSSPPPGFPAGHYYSPIPDHADLQRRESTIWRRRERVAGVDLRESEQLALLDLLRFFPAPPDWTLDPPADAGRYYYRNGMFPAMDAEFLYAMLGFLAPRRLIEVGSGFSSLVAAEANRRLLGGRMAMTCIEPYPRDFLARGIEGISRVSPVRVETLDPAEFDELASGDVLFVDSSHVVKTGSDVQYLFFEILPRLAPGVYVHLHDIFLPDEYPREWVLGEGRSWNEQYLLHAFLMNNARWSVVWASHYMCSRHPRAVTTTFPCLREQGGGGSFWMRRNPE